MRLLEQIKSLGYEVRIDSGNIKLSYKGEDKPDKGRVLPLLEELKANKDKAIKELKRVRKTYKIYSKILKDYLWIAATDKELKELVSEGVKEVVYIQAEVSMLIEEGVSKEGLEAIHKIKQVFLESRIEDVEN